MGFVIKVFLTFFLFFWVLTTFVTGVPMVWVLAISSGATILAAIHSIIRPGEDDL